MHGASSMLGCSQRITQLVATVVDSSGMPVPTRRTCLIDLVESGGLKPSSPVAGSALAAVQCQVHEMCFTRAASESQGARGVGGAVQWAMDHQRLSPTALQCRSLADSLISSAAHAWL